ncbi:MAG: hypothetical protein WC958_03360 [Dehalococcoidales bacterium]
MPTGKRKGVAMMIGAMAILAIALLVFTTLNTWGEWIASYLNNISMDGLPPETQAAAGAMFGALKLSLGGMMAQVGGYMKVVDNFVGILLTLVSMGLFTNGFITVKEN